MKILKWIIALPFIALALFVLARFALCRPNYFTVKTATPMVEKIADYIVENGVPERLSNIPDLPYRLKECKKNIVYEKEDELHDIKVKVKEKADWAIHKEECSFFYKDKLYSVNFWFIEHYKDLINTHGELDVKFRKTSVVTFFTSDENSKLIHDEAGSSFDNRFGFCRQFKQ